MSEMTVETMVAAYVAMDDSAFGKINIAALQGTAITAYWQAKALRAEAKLAKAQEAQISGVQFSIERVRGKDQTTGELTYDLACIRCGGKTTHAFTATTWGVLMAHSTEVTEFLKTLDSKPFRIAVPKAKKS